MTQGEDSCDADEDDEVPLEIVEGKDAAVLTSIVLELGDAIATPSTLQEMQFQDKELQPIMQRLDGSGAPAVETGYAFDANGILCHRWAPRKDPFGQVYLRLVLSYKLRALTFEYVHTLGNHAGFFRVLTTLHKKILLAYYEVQFAKLVFIL